MGFNKNNQEQPVMIPSKTPESDETTLTVKPNEKHLT